MTEALLDAVLRAPAATFDSLAAFRAAWVPAAAGWAEPIDRAVLGGVVADRLGFAFAAGYASALQAIDPTLPPNACLCVTESGGAHPRAIRTTLEREGDGWRLSGAKRWATLAGEGDLLLVGASVGQDGERNLLRVARVPTRAPGVTCTPLPPTPFTPEIPHYEVRFDDVVLADDAVLPGDGWVDWIKPFRTVEDTHVGAAAAAHLLRVTRADPTLAARLCALILAFRGVAGANPRSAAAHVALEGCLATLRALLADAEPVIAAAGSEAAARWSRDAPILSVAQKARRARFDAARQSLT